MKKLLKKFKSIIIVLLLVPILMLSYNSQKASANPGAVVAVVGAGVSAPVAIGVCAVVLTASACWTITPQKNKELVLQKCSELSKDVDNFILSVSTSGAETIVGLSTKGINALKSIMNDVYVANEPILLGNGSYYLSIAQSGLSTNSYIYLCEYTNNLITCTKTKGDVTSGFASTGWGSTSIAVHQYTYGWNGFAGIEVGGYNASTGFFDSAVGENGYMNIGITVNISMGSICPDKVLYKEKIDALGSVPVNYGIPVSVSADGTMYNPSRDIGTMYPDVLGPTASSIPSDYSYDGTTSVSIPKTTTGDTTQTIDDVDGIIDYIMDDTEVTPNDGSVEEDINDILKDAIETTNGKGVARNFEKSGEFEQTLTDFNRLKPSNIKDIPTKYGEGKVGKLSDGTSVVARPGSKTGGSTLEIKVSNSKIYKIRY